jgi:hypothetical protein
VRASEGRTAGHRHPAADDGVEKVSQGTEERRREGPAFRARVVEELTRSGGVQQRRMVGGTPTPVARLEAVEGMGDLRSSLRGNIGDDYKLMQRYLSALRIL